MEMKLGMNVDRDDSECEGGLTVPFVVEHVFGVQQKETSRGLLYDSKLEHDVTGNSLIYQTEMHLSE